VTPNPELTYAYEGHSIVLRFRRLVWDAQVFDSEGDRIWRKGGFRDKELAIKAAKYAIALSMGKKAAAHVTVYDAGGQIVGHVRNAGDAEDAKLRIYAVELAEAMESYEEPEDLFAFLRRKGFTLEG